MRAALFGGYAGTWVDGGALPELALSNAHLAPFGAHFGRRRRAAALRAMPARSPRAARVTRWLAGPERRAVRSLRARPGRARRDFRASLRGHGAQARRARVEQLARLVSRRGACAHPDGTARFAMSALGCVRRGVRRSRAPRRMRGVCASLADALPDPSPHGGGRLRMAERVRVNPIACEAHGMCAELLARADHARRVGLPDRRRATALRPTWSPTPSAPPRRARRSRCWSSANAHAR